MSNLLRSSNTGESHPGVDRNITEQIWREFGERLYAFVARRVGSAVDAEDILQEVFLRIHQHAGSVQRRERLTSWLFQVTRNAIIDYYRSPIRREQPEVIADPGSFHRATPDGLPQQIEHDAAEARAELAGCLQPMLGRLPLHYREAVSLVDLSGLTHAEAATRLGLSVSGTKSRVQRGRRALHETLVQCCPVQLDAGRRVIDFKQPVPGCSGCAGASDRAAISGVNRQPEFQCCSPSTTGVARLDFVDGHASAVGGETERNQPDFPLNTVQSRY